VAGRTRTAAGRLMAAGTGTAAAPGAARSQGRAAGRAADAEARGCPLDVMGAARGARHAGRAAEHDPLERRTASPTAVFV